MEMQRQKKQRVGNVGNRFSALKISSVIALNFYVLLSKGIDIHKMMQETIKYWWKWR